LLLAGTVILIYQAVKARPEFRGQSSLLVFGVLINWAGNIIYLSGANPIPGLDWTPLGLILSGVIYSFGLFQFRLLDLVPVAGETVLESMDNVVIVLDEHGRVVFLNNAFEFYFHVNPKTLMGQGYSAAFEPWRELVHLCGQQNTVRSEIIVSVQGNLLYFDTRMSNVRWRKRYSMGRVIVLDDVTVQKQAEARALQFHEASAQEGGPKRIPMVLMYRVFDEVIIEVNRSLLLGLGYERMKLLGRTMIDARLWEPFHRAEFLRALNQERSLSEYPLTLKHYNGQSKHLKVSAQLVEVAGAAYVIILAES
jgi:PAS domain S-box-containing protein